MDREGRVSGGRLLFRFGVGATELAGERLVAALRAIETLMAEGVAGIDMAEDAAATETDTEAELRFRHAVLGALAALPAWADAAIARGRRASSSALDVAVRGRGLVFHAPGARRARLRLAELRARVDARLARWAEDGRREEEAGRAMAAVALRALSEEAVAAVAESPELKRVIAEQSEGITVSAVAGLRQRSARADRLAEAVARRILGRSQ
jgi:hypothetical protein